MGNFGLGCCGFLAEELFISLLMLVFYAAWFRILLLLLIFFGCSSQNIVDPNSE